jgi:hypothetical protein
MRITIHLAVVQLQLLFNLAPEENILPADQRATIYCTAIGHGTEEEWDFLWQRYLKDTDLQSERTLILKALTCSKEIWMLQVRCGLIVLYRLQILKHQ